MKEANNTSYLLWYHSESHKKDRFFTGVTNVQVLIFVGKKPTWTPNKDEAYIFDTLSDAQAAKTFCEECKYTGLQIEPIDNTPLFVPSEVVLVSKH